MRHIAHLLTVTVMTALLMMLAATVTHAADAGDDGGGAVGGDDGGGSGGDSAGSWEDTWRWEPDNPGSANGGGRWYEESLGTWITVPPVDDDVANFLSTIITNQSMSDDDMSEHPIVRACLNYGVGASPSGPLWCEDPDFRDDLEADDADDPDPITTTACDPIYGTPPTIIIGIDPVTLDPIFGTGPAPFLGWSFPTGDRPQMVESPRRWHQNHPSGQEYWGTYTEHFACAPGLFGGHIYLDDTTYDVGCFFHSCVAQTINPLISSADSFIDGAIPNVSLNPEEGIVHIETFLWDDAPWQPFNDDGTHGDAPVRAWVTSQPENLHVDMDDNGAVTSCLGPGTPYAPGMTTSDCAYTYRQPSDGAGYGLESWREWGAACFITTGGAATSPIYPTWCTSRPEGLRIPSDYIVREIQSLNR